MPFDSIGAVAVPSAFREEIAILDGLVSLLTEPENWCREVFQRTEFGTVAGRRWLFFRHVRVVPVRTSFCLVGGLGSTTGHDPNAILDRDVPGPVRRVMDALEEMTGGEVMAFNDSHGHAEVLDLIRRARARFVAAG